MNQKKKINKKKKHVTYISEASGSQSFRLFKLLLSEGVRKKVNGARVVKGLEVEKNFDQTKRI